MNPTREVYEVDLSKCESQFEREVCQAIISKGYKVIPQYKVAEYRIDMVVDGVKSQLAVECDGDEWHGSEYYERDMARQRILERLGWRFWRIRGHEYYRNPADALEPLWKLLSDMGIKPSSVSTLESEAVVVGKERKEEVSAEHSTASGEDESEEKAVDEEELKSKPVLDNFPTPEIVEKVAENKIAINNSQKSEVYSFPPQFFFKMAHLARESNKFEPWERSLIFKIGTYLTRGWQISEKMERQAIRIIHMAKQFGMVKAVEKELETNK